MPWSDYIPGRRRSRTSPKAARRAPEAPLALERLEDRTLLNATATLSTGLLSIVGGPGSEYLTVQRNPATGQLQVLDTGGLNVSFNSSAVAQIAITLGNGFNVVHVNNDVLQPTVVQGGAGTNILYAGGGPTALIGAPGANNKLVGGSNSTTLIGGPGAANQLLARSGTTTFVSGAGVPNLLYNVKDQDTINPNPGDVIVRDPGPIAPDQVVLTTSDVSQLLQRAAAASSRTDEIVAIVDRTGNILGIRVGSGVAPNITSDPTLLSFAVDGALSLARTGAYFGNDQAPLTSRTIYSLSQSTITEREVNSIPEITNPNSTLRGPGFVAPVGPGGHFPNNINFTPQVDLFAIEHTNRNGLINPGPDGVIGTADDIPLPNEFNIANASFEPGAFLTPQLSYGFIRYGLTNAVSRGIATLPGGIPIFKNGEEVGGIGVFFPGTTGFATAENSSLGTTFDSTKPDLSLVAEYIAFAALGGAPGANAGIGTLNGIPPVPNIVLPSGRIDLLGITLDIFGPHGNEGLATVLGVGRDVGVGNPNDGVNLPINRIGSPGGDVFLAQGVPPASGNLIFPSNGAPSSVPGVNLTAQDVTRIINQGLSEAQLEHAAIRTPPGVPPRFVYAIVDTTGTLIGLYRTPDSTIFSIDVAVAKARNVVYYANPQLLQPIDQLPGIPAGVAFEARTFRFLALPHYPEGINAAPPGPFSQLNDGGADLTYARQLGPVLPASAYQSVLGHDAFFPDTNFHDPFNLANQNGIVFFPGGVPLYKPGPGGQAVLVGGLGVSGDGVDQDDVTTFAAAQGFLPPLSMDVDQFLFRNVRLPFVEFNRNPEA